jgi:hypothetical protein
VTVAHILVPDLQRLGPNQSVSKPMRNQGESLGRRQLTR